MPRTHGKTYYSQKDDDGDDWAGVGLEEPPENLEEEAASEVDASGEEIDIVEQWSLQPKLTTMYRTTTIGKALLESLEELVSKDKVPSALSNTILCQFDRTILSALKDKMSRDSRIGFQAEQLKTYRYLKGIWTFILYGIEFRKRYSFLNIDKMKIVAVEKKGPARRKRRWGGASGDGAAPPPPQHGPFSH